MATRFAQRINGGRLLRRVWARPLLRATVAAQAGSAARDFRAARLGAPRRVCCGAGNAAAGAAGFTRPPPPRKHPQRIHPVRAF